MKGLLKGCKEAECALVGGETAVMPDVIMGGRRPFDLSTAMVGIVEGEPLTGAKMRQGDAIVGLASSGLHSNGYTLARRLLQLEKWGRQMLAPTRIYVKAVLQMLGECRIGGLAHITGGAFSKLMRIGAYADVGFQLSNMPKTRGVMAELERKVGDDYEFYRTFNAGVGMCVVVPQGEAEGHGIAASVIGRVVGKRDVILKKGGRKISLL